MARIPGIQIEKDSKGRPAYARINLKKHREALPYLQQIGAIELNEPELNKEDYISSSKFWNEVLNHVDQKNQEYFKK
jgi:hypothetical protein